MDTLENAYQCLIRPGDGGLPQHSLQLLVEQMHSAAELAPPYSGGGGNWAAAQACMQELLFAADHLARPLERAQARLECARVAFQLQDEDAAMQHLGDAIRLLDATPKPAPPFDTRPADLWQGGGGWDESRLHTLAMARWMLATLLAQHLPGATPAQPPPGGLLPPGGRQLPPGGLPLPEGQHPPGGLSASGMPPGGGLPSSGWGTPPPGLPPSGWGSLPALGGELRSNALVLMQKALDDFTRLVVYSAQGGGRDFDPRTAPAPSLYGGEGDWYRDRCAEMRLGIERLVRTGSLGVPHPAPAGGPASSLAAGAPKRPAFKWPVSTLYAGNLQSLRVVGQIPAGGFGSTSIDAHAKETLPLQPSQDEFTIAAVPHWLVNLRGSPGITQLVSSNVYFILQVTGDSMDLDHIDPGDYVLLRQQSGADPMDIVAAEVVGIDTVATLKRFLRKDGEIVLEPRSANPAHTPFKFKAGSRGFQVRGVVLGVFKS